MPTLHAVQPGLTATVQKLITEADAALHFGSGALKDLFATPVFVALVVEAAVQAADPMLPDGLVTAGVGFDLRHTAPTAIGLTVTVEAVLERIEDGRLFFRFRAYDEVGEIGSGTHERVVVNLKGIMKSAKHRQKKVIANMV